MRLGIICPSEIALRRFMPALQLVDGMEFVGIGVCTKLERFGTADVTSEIAENILKVEREKAQIFIDQYGGKIFDGYESIVTSEKIDAIYIPLPPALHYKWAKLALECGKHVLVEKPSTISANDTKKLVEIASKKNLALHENYMFVFHNQLDAIDEMIENGEIGDIRLYRISFGFPKRAANDFRYNKALGGGALIDAGGYTIKYATRLLGANARIKYAQMNYTDEHDVDMYGSAAMVNDNGVTAQIAFGMDNNYKCELEAWGSTGCIYTGRVLTAPAGFTPSVTIRKGNEDTVIDLSADDAFKKSIERFIACVNSEEVRRKNYMDIVKQAELVDEFRKIAEG
ncbi:MAG: Gfo/Idh/MocA family oxidoreductase [Oscillospiraceae bacterium]|nr:Gfo/Idh/MocA family oxidoreductase [Oscillospiraceae bacterium]